MRAAPILRFKPTRVRSLHPDWRDPWERRDSWRYQAPFKHAPGIFNYTTTFWPCVGIFMAWVAFDEVVNHGPLKKYVWGEDAASAHGHHDSHDSHSSSSHDNDSHSSLFSSDTLSDAAATLKEKASSVEHAAEEKLARAREYAESLKR